MNKEYTSLGLMSGTSADGVDASTPSPEVPLINPKDVYSLFIFIFIYNNFCIIVSLE